MAPLTAILMLELYLCGLGTVSFGVLIMFQWTSLNICSLSVTLMPVLLLLLREFCLCVCVCLRMCMYVCGCVEVLHVCCCLGYPLHLAESSKENSECGGIQGCVTTLLSHLFLLGTFVLPDLILPRMLCAACRTLQKRIGLKGQCELPSLLQWGGHTLPRR